MTSNYVWQVDFSLSFRHSLLTFSFLFTAGTGCTGRNSLQSDKEVRSMSQLQLQRQVQSPDWHLSCKGCSTHTRGQQGLWLWWVNVALIETLYCFASHNSHHTSPSPVFMCSLCLYFSLPVPVANKRDTRSIEEAMNEIRAKKRQKQEDDTGAHSSSSWVSTIFHFCLLLCACVCVGACVRVCLCVCVRSLNSSYNAISSTSDI